MRRRRFWIVALVLAGLLASATPPGVVQAEIPTGYLNTARSSHLTGCIRRQGASE